MTLSGNQPLLSPSGPHDAGTRRVGAIIVLYHPELRVLERLLQSVTGQVDAVAVVDNTPQPDPEALRLLDRCSESIQYLSMGGNIGIASAQNAGIRHCIAAACSHVLLLDQDSALPERMVETLLGAEAALAASNQPVAAVGPVFVDQKTGEAACSIRHSYLRVRKIKIDLTSCAPVESDYLIASGSLISAQTLLRVGLMRDDLFIDRVDIEWGLRARHQGYRSYMVPQALLHHSIGDATVRIFGQNVNLHQDIRHYYIVRNSMFLIRCPHMGWEWRMVTAIKIPQYLVFYPFHSSRPWHSFLLLLRAVYHGLRGKLGKLPVG